MVLKIELAFAVAYALTQKIKGANLFRTVFFMPNLIGGIVLGYIWSMIFDGLLAAYQTSILTNSTWGFWGLIILGLLRAGRRVPHEATAGEHLVQENAVAGPPPSLSSVNLSPPPLSSSCATSDNQGRQRRCMPHGCRL